MNDLDATQFFRERMQSLLVRGLANEAVTTTLGIAGVSEVWGGVTPLERPAWYFWLGEVPGAYQLRLEDAVYSEGSYTGQFSISYFPARADPHLSRFSLEERTFVERDFLDETGTPRAELAHLIPGDLFSIAVVEYQVRADDEDSELTLVTMDRLRVRYELDAALPYAPLGIAIEHRRGELARDVPGWLLAVPLFRCIAGLQAHHDGSAPAFSAAESPGTEFVRREGRFDCAHTDAASVFEATFRFGGRGPASRCLPADRLSLGLSPAWWALASTPHRHDAGACACCSDRRHEAAQRVRGLPVRQ